MSKTIIVTLVIAANIILAWPSRGLSGDAEQNQREQMYQNYLKFPSYVKGGRVRPNWLADGNRFWYSEVVSDAVNWVVDPVANTKKPYDLDDAPSASETELGHAKLQTWKDEFNYPQAEIVSPDGRWLAGIANFDLYLRSTSSGNKEQVTSDGERDDQWVLGQTEWGNSGLWSPNSRYLAAVKVDYRGVPAIPIVHYSEDREEIQWVHYAKSGQKWPKLQLSVFDHSSSRMTMVNIGHEAASLRLLDWKSDSSEICLLAQNRYASKAGKLNGQLLAADPRDGTIRIILDKVPAGRFYLLEESDRFLWSTINYAGGQLRLYDLEGRLVQPLLNGNRPVTRLLSVDEEKGWVYFLGHESSETPVDEHLYRVKVDGGNPAQLTESTGVRRVAFSPSGDYFLETHSSINRPPRVDLRRADGQFIRTVSRADSSGLQALDWTPGEPFVVKDANGDREIQGILYKPANFDPTRKYPLVQFIHQSGRFHLQRAFIPDGYNLTAQALAQLGFVTFVSRKTYKESDGMEPERGFAGTATADSRAVIRQLQAAKPYIDATRVGIYGSSMNGFYSVLGILEAPDVYDAAVAVYPITDMAAHIGNHSFLGPPGGNPQGFKASSVIHLAERLRGKLLLVHGTADVAVPISHTMKLADALIRADKNFDMLVMPEESHTTTNISDGYGLDRAMRYFVEHLKP